MTKEIEIKSPIEVDRKDQWFHFMGFVPDNENDHLFADFMYEGGNQITHNMVIRTSTDNPSEFKYQNHIIQRSNPPVWANQIDNYDERFYKHFNNKKFHPLYYKDLNLEQMSTFIKLVGELVEKKGIENLNEKNIFDNPDIRKILGLDQKGATDFTQID